MRKTRTKKKNTGKALIAKHKIKGTFDVKPGNGWFNNAMKSLEGKEKKQ